MAEPRFEFKSAQERNECYLMAPLGDFQGLTKRVRIDDPERSANHLAAHFDEALPLVRDGYSWTSRHKGLSLTVEQAIGDDSGKRAPHQGSSLAGSDELLPRTSEEELEEIAVEIGIASFTKDLGRGAADLAPHCIEC
jgi:hypothetical protein